MRIENASVICQNQSFRHFRGIWKIIYIKNKEQRTPQRTPKIDPCGTPHLIVCSEEQVWLNSTNCLRSKKLLTFKKIPFDPRQSYATNAVMFQLVKQDIMVNGVKRFR